MEMTPIKLSYNVAIRIATEQDMDSILNIYDATFKDTVFLPRKYYQKHISRKEVKVLEINHQIVGAYVFEINRLENLLTNRVCRDKRIKWLRQVMVDSTHQNRGYGAILMKEFIDTKQGYYRLICEQHMIEWYIRFGFRIIEEFPHNNKHLYTMELG